jgi:hypothetical protein
MDILRAAAPFARLLLVLGEQRRSVELELVRRSGNGCLRLVGGRITSIEGIECEPLGDLLRSFGELDRACVHGLPSARRARIGARLIAAGAASGIAVQRALSTQLMTQLAALLAQPPSRVQLVPRSSTSREQPSFSVEAASAVWAALLARAADLPQPLLSDLACDRQLALTRAGAVRLAALARAHENGELARAFAALRRSALLAGEDELASERLLAAEDELASERLLAAEPPLRLQPLRACLRALGAAVDRERSAGRVDGCALLLSKRVALSRNVSASALLGLPEAASAAHARRALRRLARKLHPDRFGHENEQLERLAGDTLSALTRAEQALRTAT